MRWNKAFKIAVNIIVHSKIRSWLTIIGIVIGVAAIIAIVSIGNGFQKNIQQQLGGLGSDTISISSGFDRASECPGPRCRQRPGDAGAATKNPLTNRELQAIRSIPNIAAVNTVVSQSNQVYSLGETATVNIDGVDVKVWKETTTAAMNQGRLLTSGDINVVVVGSVIAKQVFKQPIEVNRPITINGRAFKVIGVLKESGGFGAEDRKIFMPIETARDVFNKTSSQYDSFVVKVKDENQVTAIEAEINKKVDVVRHVTPDTRDFTVISMKTIQERVSAILTGVTLFLGAIAAVSLLVGSVGIANTMFTSVLEKTKEIGIMKALGAKNADILTIFLMNSGLVGLVGGALGTTVGVGIAVLIPKLGVSFVQGGQPLNTDISSQLIIFTLVFSIVLGMVAGAVPAYRASKLKPVDALRFE
ncbi:ABC transporter permease [Candidatus Woesearchaeota archaeon]|nr:ABC transporter permease [Candidatus Woesearchaeota archaeon]